MIVFQEVEWTTIKCPKCRHDFKIKRHIQRWQLPCPYCSEVIETGIRPSLRIAEAAERED
jgi:hypothetical protein